MFEKGQERKQMCLSESNKNYSSADTESFASVEGSGGLTGWTVAVFARKFGQNGTYFQSRLPFEIGFPYTIDSRFSSLDSKSDSSGSLHLNIPRSSADPGRTLSKKQPITPDTSIFVFKSTVTNSLKSALLE